MRSSRPGGMRGDTVTGGPKAGGGCSLGKSFFWENKSGRLLACLRLERTLKRAVRFLCFVLILAIVLFLSGDATPGSAEPATGERPATIETGASANSASSNSSSGSIMITMTGMPGDPGDLGP